MSYNGSKCNERTTINETLGNLIKQSTQHMGKRRTKKRDPSPSQKCKNRKWVTREHMNKLCSQTPTNCKKHIKKREGGKLKRIINLKEPSHVKTTHLKI
jgi:hypothetical protein